MRLSMRILFCLSLILLTACSPDEPQVNADERPPESKAADAGAQTSRPCVAEWQPVADGVDYRALNCSDSRFDLHLVRLDPKKVMLEAVVTKGRTAQSVAAGALFAQNANFFDTDFRPLGVVMSAGQSLNPIHPVKWQSVFYTTREGKAAIVPVGEWPAAREKAFTGVQAGPRLVIAGERNEVAQAKPAWRSGVCIAGDGRVLFFVTPPGAMFDVWEMVDFAANAETAGGLGCRDAMLFDGGPSTQMFVGGSEPIHVEGDKNVPVFLVGKPAPK